MKILVTGSAGMVGTHLLRQLSENRVWQVLAPSKTELNLLDQAATRTYLQENQPDYIVHLAAKVGGIQANMNQPVEFLAENILISTHLIYTAFQLGIKNLINMGSSCMYPKDREILKEEDLLTGALEPTNEGYAIAKNAAAFLCQYITEQYGLNYKTIIPCNLYGPYDTFHPIQSHLMPAVIMKIHEAKIKRENEVIIWGDGTARREFLYAGDLADFIMLALHNIDSLPSKINVGLGYDLTIDDYYRAVSQVIGYEGRFAHDTAKPAGMKKKLMDISHAKRLGWQAKTSLLEGLRETYDYYLSQRKNN